MIATSLSGLQTTTSYFFKVNTVEYSILTGGTEPTFQEVAALMNAAVTGAGFSVVIAGTSPNQDIRVINTGTRGWGSEVDLGYGTSGPNLWINLNGFTGFDPAVPGRGAFSIDFYYSSTGSIDIAGAATTSYSDTPPVGTIHITGAVPADSIDVTGTQGDPPTSIALSGTGFYKIGYIWIPGGVQDDIALGVFFNDLVYQDTVYMSANPSSGIDVITGGSAVTGVDVIALVSGSAQLSGSGEYISEIVYEPTGGISLSGTVPAEEFTLTYAPSGSATFAGAGVTLATAKYLYYVSGSASFAGSSSIELEFVYTGLFFGDAYYKLDERTGSTVNDSFGSNDITLSASDLWSEDSKFVSALQFDKADYGTLGTDVDPLAISFWHKRNDVDQDSYRVFGASSDDIHWYFSYGPPFFRMHVRDNANYYYFMNGTDYVLIPEDDEYHWYYIEYYSGSNAILYIDNVYRGTTSSLFGTGLYKLHTIGNGGDSGPTANYGFSLVDDIRIYTSYRLNSQQRTEVFERSPDPGTFSLSGAAQIQPVIVAGHEYVFVPTGTIELGGQRYSYIFTGSATLSGSSPVTANFEYEASGSITLQSISTFHDFGLGYIYDATGLTESGGASITTHTRNFEYEASGGIELKREGEFIVIIIVGSYYIIFQDVGTIKMTGTAYIELEALIAPVPDGGINTSGTISSPILGIVGKTPTGGIDLGGSAAYVWGPNSGYQELGL